jgi:hypothetical protein
MRKALLIIAIVVLALVPVAAFALIATTPARTAAAAADKAPAVKQELTEQQRADLEESFQKMIELRKETINTMVQNGLMTEEQGKLALERLDQMAERIAENGYANSYGLMRGCFGGAVADGYYGRGGGMMRGNGRDWN